MSPQNLSGSVPSGPRASVASQDAFKTSQMRLQTVLDRSRSPIVAPNALRDLLPSIFDRISIYVRDLRNAFRIGFCSVFLMSDVWRIECSSNGKTSQKLLFWARISRPGASGGRSGEQVWAPKQPTRAKKRARSASGASENLYVATSEATSSEKARL